MEKKDGLYKKFFLNPLYFIREISLINNFIVGIFVFLSYLILISLYVYIQIRKGIEVLPKEIGYIFYSDKIKMDIENIRLLRLMASFFSSQMLRLFIMGIIVYILVLFITKKNTHISHIITVLTISYTIPCYVLIVGLVLVTLPLSFVVFKLCEITFFTSLYEAIAKGFGISKGKSFVIVLLLVLLESLMYIFMPSLFFTPFLI